MRSKKPVTKKPEHEPRSQLVRVLIEKYQVKLLEDGKATLGDLVRLLQLERDLVSGEQPKEVIVRWVDPS